MSEKLNNVGLSKVAHMDEYGCSFKEVVAFYEYYSNLPDYNELSCEHIDLIDRTVRILKESRENFIAVIDYSFDHAKYQIDNVVNGIKPEIESSLDKLEAAHAERIEAYNNELSNKERQLQKHKKSRSKGGLYSPFREHEDKIITLLNDYNTSQSSLKGKQTHQKLAEAIECTINQQVNLNTVKKWWLNYRNSNGKTIFKKDNN